eukprot:2862648-Rhodomonas_salina.1
MRCCRALARGGRGPHRAPRRLCEQGLHRGRRRGDRARGGRAGPGQQAAAAGPGQQAAAAAGAAAADSRGVHRRVLVVCGCVVCCGKCVLWEG